ncbi:autotransporter outer membrane beta-barrel domain-containing protein [Helicobacter winghamensis ATCC BAA-430]|uniref:autotransporter outer membrane beta-barrel domain-containing protein n=2 Tax=Helicobacter winghamensis TaxID=157268 RepID=UPI00279D562A
MPPTPSPSQTFILSKNGEILGNIDMEKGVTGLGNTLGINLYGDKALMSGNINAKAGQAFIALRGGSKITGNINIGENGFTKFVITNSPSIAGQNHHNNPPEIGTNTISSKITVNKLGMLNIRAENDKAFKINGSIDNNGGIVNLASYRNRFVGGTYKCGENNNHTCIVNGYTMEMQDGFIFSKTGDYHFKNTNGGKIGLHSWNFTESGRIIIDTDGQDKREENLKNVKFGEFNEFPDHPNYPNFVRPKEEETITEMSGAQSIKTDTKTTPITITLFGDDKIFAKGSYVQYLVLTPEEEKRICNNGNCGDVNKGTGIYDKDGRHNVAGHFIEGGAGANGESNFATLLHEGKVIKLSVGGGDTIAPVVQADGLIGELKVNDDTPGSTIGSNQINALNTNMTQTFNTLKEISTKTFRTEHTNLSSYNTLKEQVAYALYNHSKNASKNNSLDNNPTNKNLSSNNLKNHTNNNLLSYNAKNSLNDNINLLDNTSNPGNTNIASNVSNINALTNPASNTSGNNTLSNVSNNTNLEAYATDEQITTYATYAQAGASDALLYDEINKGYTDLDLLRALDDIFIKQNKKESDLYTYAVPYYNYIKDKSLGLGTTKTNSYGLLAGGQLNSNYGVYGFYINLENSKRENNTTSTDTDSTSYLAGLTYYNAFHRFSNKELYVSLNTMLGTTKSDVSMIDSDSYKDDFDFDSLNYGAELRAGVNIYNVLTNSYWTPELGLIYTGMAVDSYEIKHTKLTEYYDKTTINLLEGVAGLRFHHAYNQTTRFNAALGAKFRLYDDAKSQMKIAGETLANPLFATRDIKLPDTSYYVQFGLVKLLGDNVELSLNYQGNFAKDIQGHTAFARIGYWW